MASLSRTTKKAAKRVLHGLQAGLGPQLYGRLYTPAFGAYRKALELAYRRRVRKSTGAEAERGALVARVMPYSLVGTGGLEQTHDAIARVIAAGLEGAFVECGVAQGGCAALIATLADREGHGRRCWFFDSFEGLPDPTAQDYAGGSETGDHVRPLPRGSCLGTLEQVSALLFDTFALDETRIELVKGWFQDTLPARAREIGPIAVLRLDGDWYASTRCCLEHLYDAVLPGGAIVIDDYGTCHGCRRATDEFLEERGVTVQFEDDGRGGVVFEKPA